MEKKMINLTELLDKAREQAKEKSKYKLDDCFWVKVTYVDDVSNLFTNLEIVEPLSDEVRGKYDRTRKGTSQFEIYDLNELYLFDFSNINVELADTVINNGFTLDIYNELKEEFLSKNKDVREVVNSRQLWG